MSGENILGRIRSIIDILPGSEKKIGLAVLEDPSAVIGMTAAELSKVAGASPATVIRFCKKINIPSFTQLKIKLSAEIDSPVQEGYSDITENESIQELKAKLLANAYQSMQETVALIDEQQVDQVVDLLINAPIIYVFGVGASSLVAENIFQKWNRAGKTVVYVRDPHVLITILISAPEQAVFFAISNSGETKEVLQLVELAKKYQLHTVGLTQFGMNSLASKVELPLQTVRSNEAVVRSAATTSLHNQFIVIDILFYAYASRNFDEMIDRIQESKSEVRQFDKK
ncbi:MurR/RpiR family transcriptional regulator [Enterococcus sp. BWT-B8]|uniref:MurR/RpiR family transcriptional regulator n=1 Tax=unclassified Enterococcus TaxID=2608891 RepID=UPI001E4A097A|nr:MULTISPECIES: MurR/RpiR family transcriptional regulator [unclassified Enterococcus]MCB5952847.1 MurR/RpiR family transcriptional regulator [Enterococcus sp. BWT-B8]MCB5953856.1 MurR/RpiR family transcriptional regulator [Enterococcus sp. CWB-B31]